MADVGDRPMRRKDWRGVAEDEIVVPVADRLLFRGKVFRAEKTGAATEGFRIEVRPAADDPPRVELDIHAPAVAADLSHPDCTQDGVPPGEAGPGFLLPFEKSDRQIGKRGRSLPPVKNGDASPLQFLDRPIFQRHDGCSRKMLSFPYQQESIE